MKKSFCIFLLCSLAIVSRCQPTQKIHSWGFIDTLQSAIERKGSFSFCFNTRNSYIGNYNANIFGFNVGVCFGKKFTIGGGINTLASPIYETKYIGSDTIKSKLNFFFISYFVEYIITLSKHWRIDIPVSIGIGNSSYKYTLDKQVITEKNRTIIPFEPQVELDYNFNKYVGLYTQVGYRLMLINNDQINYNFNSVTYSVGILIYPLEIYAGLFPRTKLAHMIED